MYTIALYIYAIGALFASIFNKKIRKIVAGIPHTFSILKEQIKPTDRVVWFHAASLGEFEQGRPLIERLRKTHPEYKILLTFFSPSGYEVRKNYEGADVICYMPFDTPGNVASFLRLAHPEIALFIKYEFWTNYLTMMRNKGMKIYSISSIFRPQQHFFKWYSSTKALECFDHLFVQNEESKELLAKHGITNTTVVGDTRLDRVLEIRAQAADLPLVEIFKNGKKTFIAGSSWQPDEAIYIPYFAQHKDWKLIIAPHVIGESHLSELRTMLKDRKVVYYKDMEERLKSACNNASMLEVVKKELAEAEVLIVNCFGKLSSIYRYGEIAIVGGGFGVGIHNVPEAAVYGIPVMFGPKNKKFREAQQLIKCGGSFEYTSKETFAALMDRFISEPEFLAEAGKKAGDYIKSNAGASEKCFKHIFGWPNLILDKRLRHTPQITLQMSEQSLKDKTAKGFLWGALNNGTMQILNAVFGIVIARILTQEDYGLVGMLLIFSTIAGALQDSGFVTALTNKKDATHRDFNSVFWFNITCSFLLYIILCAFSPLIAKVYDEPRLTSLACYQFVAFFISSFSIVPRAILFRNLQQKELAIMSIISLIISGTTGIVMALNGMAYWGIATQTIVYNLSNTAISWWLSGWRPSFKISLQPVREMFGFSSKMLITYIFNSINNNVFSVLLGLFYKADIVGTYNQANKWNLMGTQFITGMVQGVAQPTFVQVGNDMERLRRSFRKMLRFTSFVAFPCMFGLALIAPEFIIITITEKWLSSANLMRILCIGGAFLPIATLYFNLIISRGKSNIYMWNIISQGCAMTLTASLVHLLDLNFFGLTGVPLMIALYVVILISWIFIWHYFLWREIRLPLFHALKDMGPFLIVASAAMLIAYYSTTWTDNAYLLLILRIVIAAAVYIGVLWMLGTNILKESLAYLTHRRQE